MILAIGCRVGDFSVSAHGAECIFGSHGGHPKTITEQMKTVIQQRKTSRVERQKKFKENARERRSFAAEKRRLDAGEV